MIKFIKYLAFFSLCSFSLHASTKGRFIRYIRNLNPNVIEKLDALYKNHTASFDEIKRNPRTDDDRSIFKIMGEEYNFDKGNKDLELLPERILAVFVWLHAHEINLDAKDINPETGKLELVDFPTFYSRLHERYADDPRVNFLNKAAKKFCDKVLIARWDASGMNFSSPTPLAKTKIKRQKDNNLE